ncbi:MAG: TetR/AcrR family transcriptional regulator [Phaeodactylibacter sp.]|nr:TetR/AcrR family transcriptional regulator [Phaeodactylibacter sp.]
MKSAMTKSEKTKQSIVAEAAVLFNQKGFSGTSLQDIMKATGLSKGGLYGHFKGGKEEIAVAAFEHAVQSTYRRVGKRTRVIENAIDKLKAVVFFYREHIFNPPVEGGCPIQNTSVEADDNHPVLRHRVVRAIDDWRSRIIYTLDKGMERGEVKKGINAADFATYFIGSLEGGIMLARIQEDDEQFDIMTRPLLQQLEAMRK